MFFCSTSLFAEKIKIGDLYYNIDSSTKTAEVAYEKTFSSDNYFGLISANIPEIVTYKGVKYRVTSIGDQTFDHCRCLTTITIPNGVTSIGGEAFSFCESLTSVTIPNTVTSIGKGAFYFCESLTSVIIFNSMTYIDDYVFSQCPKLTVYTTSSADMSRAGIHSDRIVRISQEEALARYEKGNPKQASNLAGNAPAPKKITQPANLTYVDGTLQFADATGNNAIDANETCHIKLRIRNDGKGEARNCKAVVTMTGTKNGIKVGSVTVPALAPQQSADLDIPLTSDMQTIDGNATFTVEITEPNGFGTDPVELAVATKAFVTPYLKIVDYSVTGNGGSTLQKKKPFSLQLMLQNTQYGKAEDVEVFIKFPEGVFIMEGSEKTTFASLEGGKAQSIDYEMIVNNNYTSDNIPVQVVLKEKYGKYAENRTINLQLNQTLASAKLNVKAVEQNSREEIRIASIGSEVDKNIPETKTKADKTFAVIIANEKYQHVASVPFALNDGGVFRQYCLKTLGIPAQNIHYVENGTVGNIRYEINWLKKVISAYEGQAKVIFYYAGHGIPDEADKTAYLLPVDGNGSDIATALKLDDLYKELGSVETQSVTVFMDACFSGSKRENGMLASARGVAIKAKSGEPQGKMVVFSAAQGDETAYPDNDEHHGMFTYYLLRKLQETKGDVTLQELGEYITTNVRQQSIVKNGKLQTPKVTPAAAVEEQWQNWKLK